MPVRVEGPRKVRLRPRMSAPKLGEYMDVAARRRERIVRDQKYPADFITARYRDAFDAIRASLLSGRDVAERLGDKARMIEAKLATKRYDADTNTCCAQAVRRFARLLPSLPLAGLSFSLTGTQRLTLQIEGVKVSVMPTVLLKRTNRNGEEERGALLLVLNKSIRLTNRSGPAVAQLLRQALIEAGNPNVRADLCLIVDVFGRMTYKAPRATKRLSEEIASACREIAARWPAAAA